MPMTFGEAIAAMKDGKAVTRLAWSAAYGPKRRLVIIDAPGAQPFFAITSANEPSLHPISDLPPFVEERPSPPDVAVWAIPHGDALAADWLVVDKGTPSK